MSEYFYMFSSGQYSDYCVGGLFKSEQQLSKEWFGNYWKNKLIEKFPQGKEFFEEQPTDIDVLTGYSFPKKFYEHMTGDLEPNLYSSSDEEYNGWYERKDEYLKGVNFEKDFVVFAVQEGILTPVEYEEIWCGGE